MTGLTNPEGIIPQAAIDEIRHFCLSAPFGCLLAVVDVSMYRDVCWYQTAAFPDSGQCGKRTSTAFIGKSRWGMVPIMSMKIILRNGRQSLIATELLFRPSVPVSMVQSD